MSLSSISSLILGLTTLAGGVKAYAAKGSIPSLLGGLLVSAFFFLGSYNKNSYISLAGSLLLFGSGLGRCFATNFEAPVPKMLATLGAISTAWFGYLLA
ncbi:hypothetical protein DAMA08_041730 [Martiniozyma asiatica (nom. inval.)]|nr:hypothetical protein DAMA08_041730 [Martiniozyma asiatica]